MGTAELNDHAVRVGVEQCASSVAENGWIILLGGLNELIMWEGTYHMTDGISWTEGRALLWYILKCSECLEVSCLLLMAKASICRG